MSRPKQNWLPFLRRRPQSSISNLGDILFIVNKSVKSLMCDIEVKSKKCKELTLYRCYYCIVVPIPIALRGHRGLSQSTAALRANPRSLYLCFFSRDNRPLNGIKLLTASPKGSSFFLRLFAENLLTVNVNLSGAHFL